MADEASFQDILNTPSEDIKPPVALPVGTYLCLVDGQPEFAKIGKNNTDCVNFSLKPVQAQPDVNQSALAEALDGKALQDKKIRHRLFLTPDSKWRLNEFLVEHLGIDNKGKNLGQMIPESLGRQVMVTLGHRSSDDGKQVFHEVKTTARV